MTFSLETAQSADSVVASLWAGGIRARRGQVSSEYHPGQVNPGGAVLVAHTAVGETLVDQVTWDNQKRGQSSLIGFMDGYRPSLAYRCLVPVRQAIYPARYDFPDEARLVPGVAPGSIHWVGGFLRQSVGGERFVTLLTAPTNEREEGTSPVELILVAPEHWATWLNPLFDGGPMQRSPAHLRRQPPAYIGTRSLRHAI